MNLVDKNQAFIEYILQCPTIQDSPLYFNFINAEDANNQIITQSNEKYLNTGYIDGSILKLYTFTIITYKSVADIAVVNLPGYQNENVSDMSDIQALMDWINAQEDLQNYPDFGEDCIMDSIQTTADTPSFDGIDDEVSPPLAVYSMTIEIRYLDVSKKMWRN